MTPSRRIAFGLLVAVIGVAIWWIQRVPSQEIPAPVLATPAPTGREAPLSERPRSVTRTSSGPVVLSEIARTLHSPDITPREDLEILQRLLELYRRANQGANPVGGLNEEIVDKLRGKNSRNLAVLPPDHLSIDVQGRLLDRWGRPYFFHPLSADTMEIRSSGPDGKLWTEDDVQLPRE